MRLWYEHGSVSPSVSRIVWAKAARIMPTNTPRYPQHLPAKIEPFRRLSTTTSVPCLAHRWSPAAVVTTAEALAIVFVVCLPMSCAGNRHSLAAQLSTLAFTWYGMYSVSPESATEKLLTSKRVLCYRDLQTRASRDAFVVSHVADVEHLSKGRYADDSSCGLTWSIKQLLPSCSLQFGLWCGH